MSFKIWLRQCFCGTTIDRCDRTCDECGESVSGVTCFNCGESFWEFAPRADGRIEWECPHGVGHGNHIHCCDGCCSRDDYPGLKREKKRKIKGRDWHGWVWEPGETWHRPGELFFYAESQRPKKKPTETGKWVRVKFIKVD